MLEVPAILLTRTLTSMLGRSFVGVPASGLLWGSVHARGAVALRFLRGSWLDPNNEIPRSSLAPNQLVVLAPGLHWRRYRAVVDQRCGGSRL